MLLIGSAESHGINYTGKYDLHQNDHGNKSHSLNTEKEEKEK